MTHGAIHFPSAGPAKYRPQYVWIKGQVVHVGDQVVVMRRGCENKSGIYKGRHQKTGKLTIWLDDEIVLCEPSDLSPVAQP